MMGLIIFSLVVRIHHHITMMQFMAWILVFYWISTKKKASSSMA